MRLQPHAQGQRKRQQLPNVPPASLPLAMATRRIIVMLTSMSKNLMQRPQLRRLLPPRRKAWTWTLHQPRLPPQQPVQSVLPRRSHPQHPQPRKKISVPRRPIRIVNLSVTVSHEHRLPLLLCYDQVCNQMCLTIDYLIISVFTKLVQLCRKYRIGCHSPRYCNRTIKVPVCVRTQHTRTANQ